MRTIPKCGNVQKNKCVQFCKGNKTDGRQFEPFTRLKKVKMTSFDYFYTDKRGSLS
jgi:hypothetical protein